MKIKKKQQVISVEPRLIVDEEIYNIDDMVKIITNDDKEVLGRISAIASETYLAFCPKQKPCIVIDNSEPYRKHDMTIDICDIKELTRV